MSFSDLPEGEFVESVFSADALLKVLQKLTLRAPGASFFRDWHFPVKDLQVSRCVLLQEPIEELPSTPIPEVRDNASLASSLFKPKMLDQFESGAGTKITFPNLVKGWEVWKVVHNRQLIVVLKATVNSNT